MRKYDLKSKSQKHALTDAQGWRIASFLSFEQGTMRILTLGLLAIVLLVVGVAVDPSRYV